MLQLHSLKTFLCTNNGIMKRTSLIRVGILSLEFGIKGQEDDLGQAASPIVSRTFAQIAIFHAHRIKARVNLEHYL